MAVRVVSNQLHQDGDNWSDPYVRIFEEKGTTEGKPWKQRTEPVADRGKCASDQNLFLSPDLSGTVLEFLCSLAHFQREFYNQGLL